MHYWFLIKTIIIITIIIIKYANSVSQFLEKSKFCQDPPPLPSPQDLKIGKWNEGLALW